MFARQCYGLYAAGLDFGMYLLRNIEYKMCPIYKFPKNVILFENVVSGSGEKSAISMSFFIYNEQFNAFSNLVPCIYIPEN